MSLLPLLQARGLELPSEDEDPRVGSAHDNSTGGTVSKLNSPDSASAASLVATLAPVTVYVLVCLLIFWVLRRRLPRIYRPRTLLTSLLPQERSEALPDTWFNWVKPFFRIKDTTVLHHTTLDAYLFLRYLKILALITFVGCCLTWPVLLPLHAKGGGDQTQLDSLTMGNVVNKDIHFAHVLVAYVFFGFIMFTIYRECIFYINLRHAYLMSPYQAKRLSSRTVLFLCMPDRYLDEHRLRKVFGDGVKNVWVPRDTEDLEKLVKERDQTALRLERAEIRLIKMANERRSKQLKAAGESPPPSPQVEGVSVRASRDDVEGRASPATDPGKAGEAEKPTLPSSFEAEALADINKVMPSASEPKKGAPSPIVEEIIRAASSAGDVEKGIPLADDEKDEKDAAPRASEDEIDTVVPPHIEHAAESDVPPGLPDVNGSVAAQWISARERPYHRPIANYMRRVDTIKWTRKRLKILSPRIRKLKRSIWAGRGRPVPAAFIEFTTQAEAEIAYQTQAHHRTMHMAPRFIGVRPDEVIWSVLRMGRAERIVRRFGVFAVITLAIVFWSVPSVFVGLISNVGSLADMFSFLKWLLLLPQAILGVIQGLLPALALSFLMAIVPWMLRGCAKAAGVPSLSLIELFVQNAYFAFQVVQVFLVTTLASAASSSLGSVVQEPTKAMDLLADNLPKSSNFYISYILVQCLAAGANGLVHVVDIFRQYVIAKRLGSPRAMFNLWHNVRVVHWGAVFPVFTNLGVIAISYSCIAPLILGFASVGLYAIYLVYRYNLLYIHNTSIDTRGLVYPRALMQLLVGLYLAEICMVGLFILRDAKGPMVLMIMFLIFSVLVHLSISDAISPLLYNLPRTLSLESDEVERGGSFDIGQDDAIHPDDLSALDRPTDIEEGKEGEDDDEHVITGSRGMEGADGFVSSVRDVAKDKIRDRLAGYADRLGLMSAWHHILYWVQPPRTAKPNFLLRFLHPGVFEDFAALQEMLPDEMPDPTLDYPEDYARHVYWPEVIRTPMETLWIPKDEAGVSRQEVRHTGQVIPITDEGAWLEENGGLKVDVEVGGAPYREQKVLY